MSPRSCDQPWCAAELDAAVRALSHPQAPLTRERQAEYERLCAELARASAGTSPRRRDLLTTS
ncbi:hypothetical protein [Streptomyces sp. SudanB182_2057]|uniref:hypothetical protein n=1 Tax=Streptomyces sp. SudanB182_2057 TaxID=3035281 RepID=UPI003F57FF34